MKLELLYQKLVTKESAELPTSLLDSRDDKILSTEIGKRYVFYNLALLQYA